MKELKNSSDRIRSKGYEILYFTDEIDEFLSSEYS